jgi:hypothetical protein
LLTKGEHLGVSEMTLPKAKNIRWKVSFIRSSSKQGSKARQLNANSFGDMQNYYIASNI